MSASCLPRQWIAKLGWDKAISKFFLKKISRVNKVPFPHFARKFIIAAVSSVNYVHEYNKLNIHWNKRNAIYFTVEYHAVTRRNSPNFKYSGNVTFWLTSFKTCFEAFANWTWLSTRNRIEFTVNCLAWPQGHFRIKTKFSSRQGLFTISKKNAKSFGWDFRSVRTVGVVYRLPKISALSRRARLDSSYNIKLVRNSMKLKKLVNGITDFHSERPNLETRTTFSEFLFVPGIF